MGIIFILADEGRFEVRTTDGYGNCMTLEYRSRIEATAAYARMVVGFGEQLTEVVLIDPSAIEIERFVNSGAAR